MRQKIVEICVELLDEAVTCCKGVDALDLGDGSYKILMPDDYDPEDEHWAFKPGAIVRFAVVSHLSEHPVFAAVEQIG